MVFCHIKCSSIISSTVSIIMFLSIPTSRHAEDDLLESLSAKLLVGLTRLLVSILGICNNLLFYSSNHCCLCWCFCSFLKNQDWQILSIQSRNASHKTFIRLHVPKNKYWQTSDYMRINNSLPCSCFPIVYTSPNATKGVILVSFCISFQEFRQGRSICAWTRDRKKKVKSASIR